MQKPLSSTFMLLDIARNVHFIVLHVDWRSEMKHLLVREDEVGVSVRALTSGPLWGSACVYHFLVGRA